MNTEAPLTVIPIERRIRVGQFTSRFSNGSKYIEFGRRGSGETGVRGLPDKVGEVGGMELEGMGLEEEEVKREKVKLFSLFFSPPLVLKAYSQVPNI